MGQLDATMRTHARAKVGGQECWRTTHRTLCNMDASHMQTDSHLGLYRKLSVSISDDGKRVLETKNCWATRISFSDAISPTTKRGEDSRWSRRSTAGYLLSGICG